MIVFFRTQLIKFLEKMPSSKKRFITMTVLYCLLEKETVDKQMLKKLNHTLKLSKNDNALVFPDLVAKVVWDDQLSEINLNDVTACDKVLNKLPPYLKYGPDEEIKKDITTLMQIL